MEVIKKPTPLERKKLTAALRKKHEYVFKALKIHNAKYIPKMAHYVKGLEGLQMGFFESELQEGDIYTEKVSMQMESEDPTRTLYKLKYNAHYREEYPLSESSSGNPRFYVPVDEMEIVTLVNKKEENISIPNNPDIDLPMDQMTIRDYIAIHTGNPVSLKSWINDIVKNK